MPLPLEERLQQYKCDGYTVFEGAHNKETVKALRLAADSLQALRREEARGDACVERDQFGNDPSWWFDEMLERAPEVVWPAVSNPEILDFAEIVVGPLVQLDNISLAKFPSTTQAEVGGKVTAWHRDSWSTVPIGRYQRPLAMNAISYLQNMTKELGLLRALPGAHIREMVIDDRRKMWPQPEETLFPVKAGDVVFTHHLLYHTGTPNRSGADRDFFASSYNITWLKQHNSFDGSNCRRIRDQAWKQNDCEAMQSPN